MKKQILTEQFKRMQKLAGILNEGDFNATKEDVNDFKILATSEKNIEAAISSLEQRDGDSNEYVRGREYKNEIKSLRKTFENFKSANISFQSQFFVSKEVQLNEVGMNLPWVTKEPESWGGKPDKESKWFVHGDLETAKSKGETPVEFIAFEDNRPEYNSVWVRTNMPSERSNKFFGVMGGKTTIAAKVDDKGVPTGQYWVVGLDTSTSESFMKKIKDWTSLNNYIKDELAKKPAAAPAPAAPQAELIDSTVNEGMPVGKSKLAQELAPKLNIYIGKIQNPKLENEAMVHASKIIELIDQDSEMGESIEQAVNEALRKFRKGKY